MKRLSMSLGLLTLAAMSSLQAIAAQPGADAQPAEVEHTTFKLYVNPSVAACLRDDSGEEPFARAFVTRGPLNDHLVLKTYHIKPGLKFDMFTVQRSALRPDASPVPNFNSKFGLAWYQSDMEVGSNGNSYTSIDTILLDQIFGFNADGTFPPTNTFHLGFWFNNPQDAKACGFDVTKPTFFNGEHKAGPLAMISVPDPYTGLGPLCTNPDPNHPGSCIP
jgi:hypothetical protein